MSVIIGFLFLLVPLGRYDFCIAIIINKPPHGKTNNMACTPSEDSDQPGHPPSLIRVFAVRLMGS